MEGSPPKEGVEDDEDVDAFLSALGFEFVDATTHVAEAHDIDAMSHGESRRVLIGFRGTDIYSQLFQASRALSTR